MPTLQKLDIKQVAYNMVIGLDPIEAIVQSGYPLSRAYIHVVLDNLKQNEAFKAELKYYENLVKTGQIEQLAQKQAEDAKNQEIIQQLKSFLQGVINFDLSEHLDEITLTNGVGEEITALSITSLEDLKSSCPFIKSMKFLREGVILEFYDKTKIAEQLMKLIEMERKAKPQDLQINFSVIKESNPDMDLIMSRINSAISTDIK